MSNLEMNMNIPNMPEEWKDPATWPEEVRKEWADDKGAAAAVRHRDELIENFRVVRKALDDFNPDIVVMFGDDQYENFQEDVIPPFCVLGYEKFEPKPFGVVNYWGKDPETVMEVPGHPTAAKFLATRLIEDHFDMAYAYKPLHHPMGHAFYNGVLFLDWDQKGWNYPLVPIQVNNYGRRVIQNHGGMPMTPVTCLPRLSLTRHRLCRAAASSLVALSYGPCRPAPGRPRSSPPPAGRTAS
jgi:hypothetical protein